MAERAFESTSHRPLLIGHRGAPGYRPEHTESSYRLAFDLGVDAVEPDIVVSKDGVLVIRHENEISGTTDVASRPEFAHLRTSKVVDGVRLTGWFAEDFTWGQLQTLRSRERVPALRPGNTEYDGLEPILSLADLLELIDLASQEQRRNIQVVIEIKHAQFLLNEGHDLVQLLLAELSNTGWIARPDQLIIEAFELAPLERLRDAGLAAEFVFLLESSGSPADEIARLGKRAKTFEWYRTDAGLDSLMGRVHGISVAKRDLLRTTSRGQVTGIENVVQRAHARGFRVFTWTLRPENRFLSTGFRKGSEPADWGDWISEWQMILSTGVDGVFLDHPDLLARV